MKLRFQITVLSLVLLFTFPRILRAEAPITTGLRPQLVARAGYTGSYWSPHNIEPYEISSYGRKHAYAEVGLLHPLIVFGEAFDLIQVPSFRVETNFGYSSGEASFRELLPDAVLDKPYLRTTTWLTLFKYVTLRYRNERFDATFSDPRTFMAGYTGPYSYNTVIRMRDLEVGLIGSPDGQLYDTMVEIGIYRSWMTRPVLGGYATDDGSGTLVSTLPELMMYEGAYDGVYMGLVTEPIDKVWPIRSQAIIRLGGMLGLEVRLSWDRKVMEKMRVGLEGEWAWHSYEYSYDEYGVIVEETNSRDVRMRVTLYVWYQLF